MNSYQAPIPPLTSPRVARVGGYDANGVPQDVLDGSGSASGRVTGQAPVTGGRRAPSAVTLGAHGPRRSVAMSVLLAAFLGPLGLLYSSKAGAFVTSMLFFLISLPLVALWWKWMFVAAALVAPVCVAWAFVAAVGHNAHLALRHRLLVPAMPPRV